MAVYFHQLRRVETLHGGAECGPHRPQQGAEHGHLQHVGRRAVPALVPHGPLSVLGVVGGGEAGGYQL